MAAKAKILIGGLLTLLGIKMIFTQGLAVHIQTSKPGYATYFGMNGGGIGTYLVLLLAVGLLISGGFSMFRSRRKR
ncbi:hypothetical protein PL11_005650 [Lentilactobacillus curieae]|uniref:Uncharacterized protein n=1 Tax=Lentilactobacillus curieae TaxID=1138822 RepID=A0A1S6QIL6_9LACO|nr:hypothetical protein [Lentilactobacillus curieae]AQW21452.1 hypothetical protein PL11_005650 [Lentilactobacillus curieae]